ncbi:caspase domain-containing protein [Amylostereum chailletii]|nr:caspase domain-containing protein [Amylostereum chailletii]
MFKRIKTIIRRDGKRKKRGGVSESEVLGAPESHYDPEGGSHYAPSESHHEHGHAGNGSVAAPTILVPPSTRNSVVIPRAASHTSHVEPEPRKSRWGTRRLRRRRSSSRGRQRAGSRPPADVPNIFIQRSPSAAPSHATSRVNLADHDHDHDRAGSPEPLFVPPPQGMGAGSTRSGVHLEDPPVLMVHRPAVSHQHSVGSRRHRSRSPRHSPRSGSSRQHASSTQHHASTRTRTAGTGGGRTRGAPTEHGETMDHDYTHTREAAPTVHRLPTEGGGGGGGQDRDRDIDLGRLGKKLFRRIGQIHELEHRDFRLSKCTGKRKAICIGINYTGQSHALDGCVNDAQRMARLLVEQFHFDKRYVLVFTDDTHDPKMMPTRRNILKAIRWLTDGAKMHDSLFFHYSGHGGQVRDRDGDEVDGMDEMIFPVDYKENGPLIDDTLFEELIRPLPAGCRLSAVFDSCHSGSILDLLYLYHSNGRIMGSDVTPKFVNLRKTPAEVICWSGSQDSGTSADTSINGLQVGAMSYAFIKALRTHQRLSIEDLLRDLRRHTKKYHQRPQLSASHHIDVHRTFIL